MDPSTSGKDKEEVRPFKTISAVDIDGKRTEPERPVRLTKAQFDELKPLGAIEGDWPEKKAGKAE